MRRILVVCVLAMAIGDASETMLAAGGLVSRLSITFIY